MLHDALAIDVNHACNFPRRIVLNAENLRLRTDFGFPSRLSFGNFRVKRGPLRAEGAALNAKAGLLTGGAAVARNGIDGHVGSFKFRVADFFRTRKENSAVIAGGQAGNSV